MLARAGVPLRQVAAALGVSVASVSAQLGGNRRPDRCLIPVIRGLAGELAAAEIATLVKGQQ